MRGTVIRMEYNKGFGFVRGAENNRAYFMHAKNFRVAGTFDTVKVGDTLEFTPTNTGPKADGLRAVEIEVVNA